MKPKYSICMVNLDMADYIESALITILNQIDSEFEIVLVDGGSRDKSVEKAKKIKKFYQNLKIIELERDPNRRIGADRNTSISYAEGEYILLHLDCDDLYMGRIREWVNAFHLIEKINDKNVLVAGKHINMAKKALLLEYGPYKNLHFEDRELWNRLDVDRRYVGLEHQDFVIRMNLKYKRKVSKFFSKTFYEIEENFAHGNDGFLEYFFREIKGMKNRKIRHALIRSLIMPFGMLSGLVKKQNSSKTYNKEIFQRSPSMTLEQILTKGGREISEVEKIFIQSSIFNV